MIWIPILFLGILSVSLPILIHKIKNLHQTLQEKAAENAALHMMVGNNNPREAMTKEEWNNELDYLNQRAVRTTRERIWYAEDQARCRKNSLRFPYWKDFIDKELPWTKKLEPVLQRYF